LYGTILFHLLLIVGEGQRSDARIAGGEGIKWC